MNNKWLGSSAYLRI